MNTYRRLPATFVRGSGMHLYDEGGRRYLDFVAGIAVSALGHSHPAVVSAVTEQTGRLTHTSNLYYTEQQGMLAEKLCRILGWPDGRVFFANSGAEANECALKLARKWSSETHLGARPQTVAAFGSFHGRTFETLAATGQPEKWTPFEPLPKDFVHVPYDDPSAIRAALSSGEGDGKSGGPRAASVLLEPIQGEGGVVVPSGGYLRQVSQACKEAGATLILDEVQTGIGRTGRWFAYQGTGADPSVVTMAKALGNGLPIAACAARGPWAEVLQPGDHATTLGGGPVVCAAALAVLETIENEDLLGNARATGERLKMRLGELADEHPHIKQIRGEGLMLGIELTAPDAGDVAVACLHDGLLVNNVTPSVIRLTPPLIVGDEHCDEAVETLHRVLARRRIGGR